MRQVLLSLSALFAGLALLMVANGLQGTLLGVRASLSDFGTETTGTVMACYYVGYLLGSWLTPKLIRRVGPIRVFAALASLVSFAPLAHALWVQPVAWALLRALAGACMVGIYIIAESWLNGAATNANRGRLLSAYLIVCQMSLAGGQFLLGVGDPRGFELFVLISALCSLAVVPISLTRRAAPRHEHVTAMPVRVLARRIPLPLLGVMIVSLSYGSFYAMGSVYALKSGFEVSGIGTFMASTIIGSALMQWPVGWLTDRIDRRRVMVWLCAAVAVIGMLLAVTPVGLPWLVYLLMFVYGGLSFPLYGAFVALAGDSLEKDELVGASSTILLSSGIGSALGPIIVAWLMEHVATASYPLFIALVHVVVGVLAWHSLRRARSLVVGHAAHYTAIDPQSSVIATEMAGRVAGEHGEVAS